MGLGLQAFDLGAQGGLVSRLPRGITRVIKGVLGVTHPLSCLTLQVGFRVWTYTGFGRIWGLQRTVPRIFEAIV